MRFVSVLFSLLSVAAFAKTARTINLNTNAVPTIRCALAHSTLLRFASRPTSIVAGDQDAFKIEYVGPNVSIKPLVSDASTNLFVFFDNRSYSFDLRTVQGPSDYLVIANEPQQKPQPVTRPEIRLQTVNVQATAKDHCLRIHSLGKTPNGSSLIVRFSLDCAKPGCCHQARFIVSQNDAPLSHCHIYMEPYTSPNLKRGIALLRLSQVTSPLTLSAASAVFGTLSTKIPLQTQGGKNEK